jgi:hypothetical protein
MKSIDTIVTGTLAFSISTAPWWRVEFITFLLQIANVGAIDKYRYCTHRSSSFTVRGTTVLLVGSTLQLPALKSVCFTGNRSLQHCVARLNSVTLGRHDVMMRTMVLQLYVMTWGILYRHEEGHDEGHDEGFLQLQLRCEFYSN